MVVANIAVEATCIIAVVWSLKTQEYSIIILLVFRPWRIKIFWKLQPLQWCNECSMHWITDSLRKSKINIIVTSTVLSNKECFHYRVLELHEIRKSCQTFFMKIISTLSFGGVTSPEPDLIRMLLGTVFAERYEAKPLPHVEVKTDHDRVPVIRSFLLQLLLEHE